MRSIALILSVMWLLPSVPAWAGECPAFDILKDMSAADFRATGLDRLSGAQLNALNAWFAAYEKKQAMQCAAAPGPSTSAAPASGAGEDAITSYVSGTFTGWSGGTLFHLDNGQVWEQIDDSTYVGHSLAHPKVTITRGLFNAYYLSVEGVKESVRVRRVKP